MSEKSDTARTERKTCYSFISVVLPYNSETIATQKRVLNQRVSLPTLSFASFLSLTLMVSKHFANIFQSSSLKKRNSIFSNYSKNSSQLTLQDSPTSQRSRQRFSFLTKRRSVDERSSASSDESTLPPPTPTTSTRFEQLLPPPLTESPPFNDDAAEEVVAVKGEEMETGYRERRPVSEPLLESKKKPLNLALQVQQVLGTTIEEVDEEIELEWEAHRRIMHQSLLVPLRLISCPAY